MSIHFSEILLILIVALLVIKPEQLPGAVRKLGQCISWMRQVSQKIKQEMDKPLELFSYHELGNKPHQKIKEKEEV